MTNFTQKIEFGFGIGLDADGGTISPQDAGHALDTILELAGSLFGGATVTKTTGIWTNEEGKVFKEEGRTLVVYVAAADRPWEASVRALADTIKRLLNQQAVAVIETPVTSGGLY